MADNRTGLSAADIAESFRDRCGDGSVEWVYTPTQTWVLLDAADMLDENDEMLMRLNAEYRVRQNLAAENAMQREWIREAVRFMGCVTECDAGGWAVWMDKLVKKARELEVDA